MRAIAKTDSESEMKRAINIESHTKKEIIDTHTHTLTRNINKGKFANVELQTRYETNKQHSNRKVEEKIGRGGSKNIKSLVKKLVVEEEERAVVLVHKKARTQTGAIK